MSWLRPRFAYNYLLVSGVILLTIWTLHVVQFSHLQDNIQTKTQNSPTANTTKQSSLAITSLENDSTSSYKLDARTTQFRTAAADIRKMIELNPYEPELLQNAAEMFPFLQYNVNKDSVSMPKHHQGSIGIVMCVGKKQIRFAAHFIKAIRIAHKSEIPIQITYAGPKDLSKSAIAYLTGLAPRITAKNLLEVFDVSGVDLVKFANKPFALLQSPFQHTILADADIVWMTDPELLFKDSEYIRTGTYFFHDRLVDHHDAGTPARQEWVHQLLSPPHQSSEQLKRSQLYNRQSSEEQDSGIVVINKGHAGIKAALLYICWMHMRGNKELLYAKTYGDKESYWLAFELLGLEYHFEREYAAIIGWPVTDSDVPDKVCGNTMLHRNEYGRNLWYNGSLFKNYHLRTRQKNDYLLATHIMSNGDWIRKKHWSRFVDGQCMILGTMTTVPTDELALLETSIKEAKVVDAELKRVKN